MKPDVGNLQMDNVVCQLITQVDDDDEFFYRIIIIWMVTCYTLAATLD